MDMLIKELTLILGESVSRIELLNQQTDSQQFTLYNQSGLPLPVIVHRYNQPGMAEIIARKLLLLQQQGTARVPEVRGVIVHEHAPFYELLLTERLPPVTMAHRAPQTDQQLRLNQQVVEAIHSWHQCSSDKLSGYIDSSQQLSWPEWWQQRCQVLLTLLTTTRAELISAKPLRLLENTLELHPQLFQDLTQPNVLVHGNLQFSSIVKDPHLNQLLAFHSPGRITWAPAEYDLYRLGQQSANSELLELYQQRYPLDQGMVWRSELYSLWDEVEALVYQRSHSLQRLTAINARLEPWLTP